MPAKRVRRPGAGRPRSKVWKHEQEIVHLYTTTKAKMGDLAIRFNTTTFTISQIIKANNGTIKQQRLEEEYLENYPQFDYDTFHPCGIEKAEWKGCLGQGCRDSLRLRCEAFARCQEKQSEDLRAHVICRDYHLKGIN